MLDRRSFTKLILSGFFSPLLPKIMPEQSELLISAEVFENITGWGCNVVDEKTRFEIYTCGGLAILDSRKILSVAL